MVISPASYWRLFLKTDPEKVLLRKMRAKNKTVNSKDTKIMLTVTQRSERDITKIFSDTDIEWPSIEKQLILWANLFRTGKKLRIKITFNYNYEKTSQLPSTSRRTNKRSSSATQWQLNELDSQVITKEDSTGQPSVWREIYKTMRYNGPPCNKGPHC